MAFPPQTGTAVGSAKPSNLLTSSRQSPSCGAEWAETQRLACEYSHCVEWDCGFDSPKLPDLLLILLLLFAFLRQFYYIEQACFKLKEILLPLHPVGLKVYTTVPGLIFKYFKQFVTPVTCVPLSHTWVCFARLVITVTHGSQLGKNAP